MKKLLICSLLISGLGLAGPLKNPNQLPKTSPEGLPVVFHKGYDIGFMGLEKLHPFDSKKYGKVYAQLMKEMPDKIVTYTPKAVTDSELSRVHARPYLDKFKGLA